MKQRELSQPNKTRNKRNIKKRLSICRIYPIISVSNGQMIRDDKNTEEKEDVQNPDTSPYVKEDVLSRFS